MIHIEPTREKLETLSVLLRTKTASWVDEFVLGNGANAMCDLLELHSMKRRGVGRTSEADDEVLIMLLH